MPKTPCYLDGNLHRYAAQVKIELETWNLGDIFFLFLSKHMSLCHRKISKIPQKRTTRAGKLLLYSIFRKGVNCNN